MLSGLSRPHRHHGSSRHSHGHHRNSHPQNTISSHHMFNPFGLGFGMNGFEELITPSAHHGGGFTSFSTFNSNFGGSQPGGNVKRTSTSTRYVGGKKITTTK